MKQVKRRWILFGIIITIVSIYNSINAYDTLNVWYGDITIHYWISCFSLVFSIGAIFFFSALIGWYMSGLFIKEFKKWIINVVMEGKNKKSDEIETERTVN